MTPAVTIKTIAEQVGVSPSTVSNAYNKPGQLSAELRTRILAVADELGYSGPSAAARTLRSGRAGALGVLFTDRLSYAFHDPFAVGFLAGLSEVAEAEQLSLVLMPLAEYDGRDVAESELVPTAVRQALVDAVTYFCIERRHPARQLFAARGIPAVSTDRSDKPDASWVAIDEDLAGARIGEHLARLGHRRVSVIAPDNSPAGSPAKALAADQLDPWPDESGRVCGLARELSGAEITIVAGGHNAISSGASAAAYALDVQDRPTAIIGLSDVLALGALEAIRARGLVAGRDVSVAGFDDIPGAAAGALTTIRQPIAEKGRMVGRLMVDQDATDRQVLLPTELIVRASTGPAPHS